MSAGLTAQNIRIVLIGKTGVGKSSTGNSILGIDAFHKAASSKSVTKQCLQATAVFNGLTITVVDTPGWCDTELSEDQLTKEMVKCIDMTCPGPHVFLLILAIGNRYTTEEKKAVQRVQEIFGEGATRYTMILFTRGDNLDDTFDNYLQEAAEDLKALIAQCNGRCHVFNNKDKSRSQVSTLLKNIQDMVQCNGGGCFTNTTYQLLEKYKRREAELKQEADAARREKEAREAEIQRLLQRVEQQEDRFLNVCFSMMEVQNSMRWDEEERTERRLSAQAAEHQRMIDLERQKQKELQHQRHIQEEMQRKQEEARNKRRLERLEKERQAIQMRYEATIHELEEEKQLKKIEMENLQLRIRKKKSCIIS